MADETTTITAPAAPEQTTATPTGQQGGATAAGETISMTQAELDKLIAEQTGLPVHVTDDPLSAVAEGTGVVLHELSFLRKVARSDKTY